MQTLTFVKSELGVILKALKLLDPEDLRVFEKDCLKGAIFKIEQAIRTEDKC